MEEKNVSSLFELANKVQKYVVINSDIIEDNESLNELEVIKKEDILSSINNKDIFSKIYAAFVGLVEYLVDCGIPFETIAISSKMSVCLKTSELQTYKNCLMEGRNMSLFAHPLKEKVLDDVAYLELSFDIDASKCKDKSFNQLGMHLLCSEKLNKFKVNGYVNYNEFANCLLENGFAITTINGKELITFDKYIEEMENGYSKLLIVANFEPSKTLVKKD